MGYDDAPSKSIIEYKSYIYQVQFSEYVIYNISSTKARAEKIAKTRFTQVKRVTHSSNNIFTFSTANLLLLPGPFRIGTISQSMEAWRKTMEPQKPGNSPGVVESRQRASGAKYP